MKKLSIIAFMLISMASINAQDLKFGIIGGLDFNSDTGLVQTITGEEINTFGADNNTGFHIGVFTRIGLAGVYIQPELLYTNFKSEYSSNNGNFDLKTNRLDIPVNVGKKILKIARVQIGPVFSYHFDDVDFNAISNLSQDDFSVGAQIGAGIDLTKKLGADIRYEFQFGETTTTFIESSTGFRVEEQPNLLRLSLSYAF